MGSLSGLAVVDMDLLTPCSAANSRQVHWVVPLGLVRSVAPTMAWILSGPYVGFRPRPGATSHKGVAGNAGPGPGDTKPGEVGGAKGRDRTGVTGCRCGGEEATKDALSHVVKMGKPFKYNKDLKLPLSTLAVLPVRCRKSPMPAWYF